MEDGEVVERLAHVLDKGNELQHRAERNSRGIPQLDPAGFAEWKSQAAVLLVSVFGEKHSYVAEFKKGTEYEGNLSPMSIFLHNGQGILTAALEDVTRGWMRRSSEEVRAEVFSDYLEMAQHLFDETFKDAAAVIAGSTLEEHLRKLCDKHGVATTTPGGGSTRASTMNDGLRQQGVYGIPEWRQVSAWLDTRNKAAHGDYEQVLPGLVELMIPGIRDFIVRHPG